MTNLTEEQKNKIIEQFEKNYIPLRYKNCSLENVPEKLRQQIRTALKNNKGVFLYGNAGTGKTYILYSIIKEIFSAPSFSNSFGSNNNNRTIVVTDVPWLSIRLKSYVSREEDPSENLREYFNCKYLFLDDLGAEKMTDFFFESFYNIIGTRYEHMRPCFFTSNYSLKEISEKINDRIASRIVEMCEVIKLEGGDKRIL